MHGELQGGPLRAGDHAHLRAVVRGPIQLGSRQMEALREVRGVCVDQATINRGVRSTAPHWRRRATAVRTRWE